MKYFDSVLSVWIVNGSASWTMAVLSMAVVIGLGIGAVRIYGIRLGVSGVLFAALAFGQLGLNGKPEVLEFLRDFALIIFVYAIGLQVGPGLIDSLRKEGLRLNLLSLAVIILGAVMTWGFVHAGRLPRNSTSGLYAGAFTTTPGLAAGQDMLQSRYGTTNDELQKAKDAKDLAGLAYTVTYPFGIVGPILVIALLRKVFSVNVAAEKKELDERRLQSRPQLDFIDLEVTSPDQVGIMLKDHPILKSKQITFSRLRRADKLVVPTGDTVIQFHDIYRAIGVKTDLADLAIQLGSISHADMEGNGTALMRSELVVTRTQVLRQSLQELNLIRRMGVTIVRVNRSGVDLLPDAALRLQFGDQVSVVGPATGISQVEAELGNSPETLNRPQLVPIFLGIVLGVLIGTLPIAIPGLSLKLRIGLAGGPMLAAILLSQLGSIGSMVWYMPTAANQLFRDFGLAVFLACVGLSSGNHFLEKVMASGGTKFIFWGALVTVLPVFLIAVLARKFLKMNFVTLSGFVAGAMTSSPALSFAHDLTESEEPALAYAAVAPLGMLAPIVCAQLLVVFI